MRIHRLTADEAIASLHSRREGMASADAARRLEEFGPNRIERPRRTPAVARLFREFTHFFAAILWVAAGLAFWAEWSSPGMGMGALGWAVVGVIVVNGLFSFGQVYRAERALGALERLLPPKVDVLRDGVFLELDASRLVPGDVVGLEAGDLVPADCRLIEAYGFGVNNATLSGESVSQARDAEPCSIEGVLQSTNVVLAGTTVASGDAKAIVYATGMHTEFGRIARLTQSADPVVFPLQRELRRLSRIVAILAGGLGAVFFVVGHFIGLTVWQSLMFAVGMIVANVPEGLLPTVTLALAIAAQRMAQRNVLIRRLPAVETLGSATVICTDKTGTLTLNRMSARQIFLGGALHDVDRPEDLHRLAATHREFFEALSLCQNLKLVADGVRVAQIGDPTEMALVETGTRALSGEPDFERIDEVPFDSERRRLSTLHRTPDGLRLYTKGALEAVSLLSRDARVETTTAPLDEDQRRRFVAAEEQMADRGLRVLAVATRRVPDQYDRRRLETDLVLLGLVGLEDPPRPEVPAAIRTCRQAGIRVIMVTGDHPRTALGIARQIGLVESAAPLVFSGDDVRRMSNSQLQLALGAPEILFARVGADQKMRIVQLLQRKGETVAVTGDGVNDAPALKQADIGIAMGVIGTDAARETADMVLADDNFASIVAAVEEGRAVFDNVRKFLTYILTSNVPEVVPYLAFVIFRAPLALSIIQILAVDLGTDMLPALALGAERPDPEIMKRPPRSRKERLVSVPLLLRAYGFLGLLQAATSMAAFFAVLYQAGWRWGDDLPTGDALYRRATSACFATIVAMQVVNVFHCRSERRSLFGKSLFDNKLLWSGIGVEVSLAVVILYSPWGNSVFGTSPLAAAFWLVLVPPLVLAMFIAEEARKWLVRRRPR